jgi:hypothetical protein
MRAKFCNKRRNKLKDSFQHSGKDIPESPRSYLGRWRVSAAVRLQAPPPLCRHLCLGDLLGLGNHISFAEPESSDPGRIKPSGHLADFVCAALKRENPARDKCAHYVIS